MVGKTPQVREIVYNVLDDNGDRTVIAKGASTVDVGDTEQLFARTSDIEVLSSNTFSNVSNLQSNVIELETFLSSISFPGGQGVYQPILSVLEQNHVSNAARVEILESIHTSNVVNINANFSNITVLQDDVNSNVTRIETLESIHVSNVANINGNFSNIFIVSDDLSDNVTRIEALEANIGLVTNFGDITGLQTNVASVLNRVGGASIRIGTLSGGSGNGGPGNSANSAIAIGDNAGAHMGNRSIAIGGFSGFNTQAQQASQTERSIVISAQSDPLRATRTDTLVISPMIEDNSNTIQMMGYNLTSNELVNTSLLKLLSDSNIHSTTNVYIGNGTTKIDISGNGSFGGNIDINTTLDVGGASSFGGAMTLNNNLETIGTSSFGGKMQVNNDIDCNGESFIMKNGSANKIIFREDGTGSFLSKVEVDASGNSTTASPAFEVAGASVFKSDVKIGDAGADNLEVVGTSSFGGDMKVNNDLVMTNGSFTMNDGSNDQIKLQTNGNSSFSGQMTSGGVDVTSGTVDIYHTGAQLRVGEGPSDFKASINQDGQGSFTNIIAWDAAKTTVATPALKVEGRTLLNNGLSVSSTAASSFAGTCSFVSTSSFGGAMTVHAPLAMTNGNFTMNDGSDKIRLQTNGNSSFSGQMTSSGIDVTSGTVDIYHTGAQLRVGENSNDLNIELNADGTSSFLGAMQINNNLTADGTLIVKNGGIDRITLTPNGTNDSLVKILGNIETYNAGLIKTKIDSGGNGSFLQTVTAAAFSGGGVSTTNAVNTVVKRDNSGNFSAGTITASGFAGNGVSTTNTGNTVVKRDASGNFSAGTITAYISGNISGQSTSCSGNSATTSDGTSANTVGAIVRRNNSGDFSARTITAYLSGNISGSSTSCSGNSSTASRVSGNQSCATGYIEVNGVVTKNIYDYGRYHGHPDSSWHLYSHDDADGARNNGVCAKFHQNVWINGFLYVSSDMRVKSEITTLDQKHSLDVIEKLRPVSYKSMISGEFVLGYIGQELQDIIPPAVNSGGIGPIGNIDIYGVVTKIKSVTNSDGREGVSMVIELEKPLQEEIKNKKDVFFAIGIQLMRGNNRTLLYDPDLCDDPTDMSIELLDYNENEQLDEDTRFRILGEIVTDILSVDYNEVFVVLSSAIKELNDIRKEDRSRIETLENQVSQLLARVEALESK